MSHELKVILHGGDGKLDQQLGQTVQGELNGQSVAYVVAALEPVLEKGEIEKTFDVAIHPFFASKSAARTDLIFSAEIGTILDYQVVILSGGNTQHLLDVLAKAYLETALKSGSHKVEVIAGISAGAIALAGQGVGTKEGQDYLYTGMGLFPATVVPHIDSHPERRVAYPTALCLGAEAATHTLSLSNCRIR